MRRAFGMLDFNHFQVLTFDCYGTLIDWESGILGALRPILHAHGKQLADSAILQLYSELEPQLQQGDFQPYGQVLKNVVGGFGKRLGFSPSDAEAESLAESLKHWRPFPDTVASLRELKTRYKLAIISNTEDALFAETNKHLCIVFDQVVTAQQAQAYKPSHKIFRLALKKIAVPADRILHVAQSLYHDVVPARELGLATVWVNRAASKDGSGATRRAADAQPDLEVPDLETLARLVMQAGGSAVASCHSDRSE